MTSLFSYSTSSCWSSWLSFLIASRVVAVYWVVFGVDIAVLAEWVSQVSFVGILTGEGACFRAVVALAQVLQSHFFYVFLSIIPPQNVVFTETVIVLGF